MTVLEFVTLLENNNIKFYDANKPIVEIPLQNGNPHFTINEIKLEDIIPLVEKINLEKAGRRSIEESKR
jgi:hypothetical protein